MGSPTVSSLKRNTSTVPTVFALNHGKDSFSYHPDTVDFFGLVVLPLRTIYIVPQESVGERIKVCVYPEISESVGLLERYRENWGLL